MARVEIDEAEVIRRTRRIGTARGRAALSLYRRAPLKRDASGYPFGQHEGERSIRSTRSHSIRPIPRGVRIEVKARGAPFIEEGNQDSGEFITAKDGGVLAVPAKSKRSKLRSGKGRIVMIGGRPYFMLQRVRTYKGTHLLERSVRQAFGLGMGGMRRVG